MLLDVYSINKTIQEIIYMTVIIAATANLHKFEEYRALLGSQDVELHSLRDYPGFTPSEETGKTFKENASIKAVAACNTEVSVLCFSRSVNNAAHNGNVNDLALGVDLRGCLAELFCKSDKIDPCSSAGGAGYNIDALSNKAEGFKYFLSCIDLADGVSRQGDTDSIADAVKKK